MIRIYCAVIGGFLKRRSQSRAGRRRKEEVKTTSALSKTSALEKGSECATVTNSQTSIPGRRKSRIAASGSYDLISVADSPDVDPVSVRFHVSSRGFILAERSLSAAVCSCKTVMNSPSIERGQTDCSGWRVWQSPVHDWLCYTSCVFYSTSNLSETVKRVSQTSVVSFYCGPCSRVLHWEWWIRDFCTMTSLQS